MGILYRDFFANRFIIMHRCRIVKYYFGVPVVPEVYFFLELTGISIDKISSSLAGAGLEPAASGL